MTTRMEMTRISDNSDGRQRACAMTRTTQVNISCAMRCYEAGSGSGAKALRRTAARYRAAGRWGELRLYMYLVGRQGGAAG